MMRIDELFEAEGKTAVAAFGRMNPPTIGHEKLVDAIKSQPGDHYLFLSQTQKPKDNPLPFDVKLKFAKRFFPGVNVGHPDVRTPMHMMKMLESLGYTDVIYVAGSDRVDQFDKLLNDYNGKEYSFNSIKVISAGERDPDADGAEGMSASKMRAAAADDDFESFEQGVPKPDLAQDLYNAVRQGMGLKEPMAESCKYGRYWCSTDNKWKCRQGPKQSRSTTEAAEPPEGISKRELLNRSLRAQGHQVVTDKKKKSKQGYQKHRGTNMKFNDVYSEAGSYYNNVDPYVAELGRRLMKAAESMKDETKSGMLSIVGSELTSFDGNLEKLLKKLSKYGVSGNDLTALMDLADKKLPPTSASDVPDPEPQDDEDDLRDGNEFANKVRQLKAQGAKPGTKFKTSDGEEHVLTDDNFEEAAKQHPRDKIAKRFEKVAGYSLEDREKEYQAILDKYKKEKEVSEKDVDESLDEGSNYQDGISVIQHLEGIVRDKQAKAVPFMDGKGKVDMFTASAVTKVFDAVNDENQRKMLNMIGTRAGFMKIADFAMKQARRTESMGEDNHDPSDHGEYAEREMAETQLEFIKYACEEIDEHLQQFPMPEWFQNKLSGVHETMTKLHAYIEGQEGKVGITDDLDESGLQYYTGKKKYGKEGMAALAKAGREGASEEELGRIKDKYKKEEFDLEEEKKGLYYYVNKKKKSGRKPNPPGHPDRPSAQDWKDAAKTAKESQFDEGKKKGVDGKACWDGYKRMGTKKKGGKTVDNCVPMSTKEKNK